jgi:hypothetical protein
MDGSIANYYIMKNMEIRVAKWGTPKKYSKTKNK